MKMYVYDTRKPIALSSRPRHGARTPLLWFRHGLLALLVALACTSLSTWLLARYIG